MASGHPGRLVQSLAAEGPGRYDDSATSLSMTLPFKTRVKQAVLGEM